MFSSPIDNKYDPFYMSHFSKLRHRKEVLENFRKTIRFVTGHYQNKIITKIVLIIIVIYEFCEKIRQLLFHYLCKNCRHNIIIYIFFNKIWSKTDFAKSLERSQF